MRLSKKMKDGEDIILGGLGQMEDQGWQLVVGRVGHMTGGNFFKQTLVSDTNPYKHPSPCPH